VEKVDLKRVRIGGSVKYRGKDVEVVGVKADEDVVQLKEIGWVSVEELEETLSGAEQSRRAEKAEQERSPSDAKGMQAHQQTVKGEEEHPTPAYTGQRKVVEKAPARSERAAEPAPKKDDKK
jgi:hypothetical protein